MWGEFWSTLGAVGLALIVACTLLNVAAALILARLSLPQSLKRRLEEISSGTATAVAEVKAIEAQVGTWKASLETLIETNEDAFERAERKRASAASAASRSLNGMYPPIQRHRVRRRAERSAWPISAVTLRHTEVMHGTR